jgi:hypothetical protein
LNNRENTSKHRLTTDKSSIYTGVSWYKNNKRWKSQIQKNGKIKHLGYFQTEHEAHLTYEKELQKNLFSKEKGIFSKKSKVL